MDNDNNNNHNNTYCWTDFCQKHRWANPLQLRCVLGLFVSTNDTSSSTSVATEDDSWGSSATFAVVVKATIHQASRGIWSTAQGHWGHRCHQTSRWSCLCFFSILKKKHLVQIAFLMDRFIFFWDDMIISVVDGFQFLWRKATSVTVKTGMF